MKPRRLEQAEHIYPCGPWEQNQKYQGRWSRLDGVYGQDFSPFLAEQGKPLSLSDVWILEEFDGRILLDLKILWNEE